MSEKLFTVKSIKNNHYQIAENDLKMLSNEVVDYMNLSSDAIGSLQKKVVEQQDTIQFLKEENNKLRELIKENVFGRYGEGSLADLEFKAIAYDDIVKLGISNESEPKVIVFCKQGKKENVKSFCQMFIPFGIAYEIVEMVDDE